MKSKQPIGVFDSGVGGLSVLLELKRKLPNENFVFLADQINVPYGKKSRKELTKFAFQITDYFIRKHNIKLLVIACNTSTCYSIAALRKKYSLPMVGTVPAIKPASESTKSQMIALISTPATSKSSVVKKLIKHFCRGIEVLNIGCKNLEDAVEKGDLESAEVTRLLTKYLKQVKNSGTDELVLGCTHYPFLKTSISKILGSQVELVDGNKAIAKQTDFLLRTHKIKSKAKSRRKVLYLTTGNPVHFSKVASKLLGSKIKAKKVAI